MDNGWPTRHVVAHSPAGGMRLTHSEFAPAESSGRRPNVYAALDLGTNNCRLLIARPTHDSFRVVDAFSRIVRLGEGLGSSKRLAEDAIGRAVQALKVCRDKMDGREVGRARLIATAACREAENGEEFCERVLEETGLHLETIDQETEARLAAIGCSPLVDPDADGVLLFDIGGGSSEVVWLQRRAGDHRGMPAIHSWVSLPVGVVTLAESYGGVDVSSAVFEAMVAHVACLLAPFAASIAPTARYHMLGTSGTVTTLAGIQLGLPRYERRRVDGTWLNDAELHEVMARVRAMNYEQRIASPCIGHERADLVLAGCAILAAIRQAFPCDRLRVADRGVARRNPDRIDAPGRRLASRA